MHINGIRAARPYLDSHAYGIGESIVKTVLLPVDGSESANRAAWHVTFEEGEKVVAKVVLLNVQPEVLGWQTRDLAQDAIRTRLRARADEAFAFARRLLAAAKIPFEEVVESGDPAETIVRVAAAHHCDAIVLGTRGLGRVAGAMLGSVAYKVVHHAAVPVTLVK